MRKTLSFYIFTKILELIVIALFKPNDPLRLALGLFLFLGLTIPLFWIEMPITTFDIVYNTIGSKINTGAFMYKDIWDYTGVFTGLSFAATNYFAHTDVLNSIIALIFLFILGVKTTLNLNSSEVFTQKNYLTIYFFILSIFSSFILLKLSPQLLSLFFLSFTLNIVLKHFSGHLHDEERILLGFWHGLASLFYFPCTIFFVFHLLFFAAFAKLRFSSYLLSIFGYLIPYFFIAIIYYTQGGLPDFLNRGIVYYFQFNFRNGVGFENYFFLSAPLLVTIIIGYFSLLSQFHNNIQSTTKALMMLWFFSFIIISFWTNFDPYNLIYLCIPFAYFCTYMFLVIKNKIVYRVLSISIPVILIGLFWSDISNPIRVRPETNIIVNTTKQNLPFKNKKLLVLGNDINKYYNQQLATKYLYWPMAQKQIRKINTFAGLTMIYTSITEDMPEVIIDEVFLMPKLQESIPQFKKTYRTKDSKIYYLTK